MTEQELRTSITPCIMAGNTWFVFDEIKSYADARVAQECKVLDEVVTLLHQTIASRNTEIAELKAESKYWNERWEAGNKFQDAAFNSEIENYHEVKRLNAEIKRLRDGIQKVADHLWVREPRNMSWLELRGQVSILHGLLSPAPVTETTTDFQFRNRPQDTTLNYPSSKPQWLTANDNLYRLDTFTQSQIINMGGMDYDCNIRGIITEDHGDAGWIAYSKDIKGTVGQGLTKKEACDEFCNSLIAIVLFLSREAAPVTEDEDYDPEFCPQCNSMEWYNGDGECEYGCHHCGHVWIHGTPLNEDQE
jgi:hypothetical protein